MIRKFKKTIKHVLSQFYNFGFKLKSFGQPFSHIGLNRFNHCFNTQYCMVVRVREVFAVAASHPEPVKISQYLI